MWLFLILSSEGFHNIFDIAHPSLSISCFSELVVNVPCFLGKISWQPFQRKTIRIRFKSSAAECGIVLRKA